MQTLVVGNLEIRQICELAYLVGYRAIDDAGYEGDPQIITHGITVVMLLANYAFVIAADSATNTVLTLLYAR